MNEKIDPVDEFLDLLENKYVIRIKTEANNIPFNKNKIRMGLAYRSGSLAGLLWEAINYYKSSPSIYRTDLEKLITAIKAQGAYEESEGLPRKYQECLGKYNKLLEKQQDDKKDLDDLIEEFESLKKDRDGLLTKNKEQEETIKQLNRELDKRTLGKN